jgi:2-dehydro-3-deoxyphosphogluconate aldolase / (4S)-4-hydroxy-2-oxoglutarate aldolase
LKTRKQILGEILNDGIVAIVRLKEGKNLLKVAEALHAGGLNIIEFTMNTPGAIEGIRLVNRDLPEVTIGAGTVLNPKSATTAIEAGAQFIVSPNTKADVIEATHAMGKVSVPAAYTPTEIGLAMDLYADLVKLFPAKGLGPNYIKELMGPFNGLQIMPTGGVTIENVPEYFQVGAVAVAAGGSLVNDTIVDAGDYALITQRAQELRNAVDSARKELTQ